ncbi:polysaccharide deacetylase family protein [Flavobacteriales bacterium]|nr:polysaccharide deacetylase family protein [Flavobacteriales bacterium]
MGDLLWNIDTKEKELYLTFDDGPTPVITEWVLQTLNEYKAKATFFCLGKNVDEEQNTYELIQKEGHAVGNHTQNHVDGWKTDNSLYFKNIEECSERVKSKLFRPPYGKISLSQSKVLKQKYKIVMWDVLSADFDLSITPEKCARNVLDNASKGSIIVMHDSVKAEKNLRYALPKILAQFTKEGFQFKALPMT